MTSLADNFEQAATTDPKSSKTVIRPQAPISSIAAGKSQFTAIADTSHADASIVNTVTREMDDIAKAGVKKILLEIPIYPVGHPARTEDDHKLEDIMARMNARPPQISEPEIIANQLLFASMQDETPNKETGSATANLLVKAMQAGIEIHFVSDDRGHAEGVKLEQLQQQRQDYIDQNVDTAKHLQKFASDKNYLCSLDLSENDKNNLALKMQDYREEMAKSFDAIITTRDARTAARMDYGAEEERAKRFADVANGEKTLLIFGADHFSKGTDLNEALDQELKTRALKNGTAIPAKTEVVEIWASEEAREIETGYKNPNAPDIQQPAIRIYADTQKVEIPEESADRFSIAATTQAPAPKMERAP